MKNTVVSIVAGGSLTKKFLPDIAKSDSIVGVDRGALWLIQNNIHPDVAIGDFDSVTPGELDRIKKNAKKVLTYPQRKNATDLELAVDYVCKLHPKEVMMYGVLGKRLDHAQAALQLLVRLHTQKISAWIRDSQSEVLIVTGTQTLQRSRYEYISIIPVSSRATVSLRGFAYDVYRKIFSRGSTIGISNEIRGKSATIKVHEGMIVVIRGKD